MSYEETLRIFCKNNIRLLLSDPFLENIFLQKKKEYFGDLLKNKYKRPKNGVLAKTIIDSLINSVKNFEDFNSLLNKPFIKRFLSDHYKKIYIDEVSLVSNQDADLDLKRIKENQYKEYYKELVKKEIINESLTEIDEAIEIKRREYYSTPSRLDIENIAEPVIYKNVQIDQKVEIKLKWWRKLELLSDPFPGNSLDKIDKKIWDEVVYKTSIFNEFLYNIEKFPEDLFKNLIFYGEHGSGKSTLLEYIQPSLIKNKVIPLYVIVSGEYDAKSLQIKYEKKLIAELKKVCFRLNIYTFENMPSDKEELIDYYINKIIEEGNKGILIIIDELHKNPVIEPVMDFLNNLQSYSSELHKNKPELDFGIYVAGSFEWKYFIEHTPKFSGSFIDYYDMPIITPEIAQKTINMRIKAFSTNKENPKAIKLDAVKRAFDNLISSQIPITYRYVIKHIVEEFKRDNFDILTYGFLPKEKRENIRVMYNKSHAINTRFNIVFNGGKNIGELKFEGSKKKLLENLIKLYIRKVMYDDDPEIIENRFFYKRLAEVGLITKIVEADKVKWIISKELDDLNVRVKEEFNISLENYLIDIYYYDDSEQENIVEGTKRKYNTIFDDIPINISKNIVNAIKNSVDIRIELDEIFTNVDKMSYLQNRDRRIEIREKIKKSMLQITRALSLYENISLKTIDIFWKEYWYNTDNILKYDRYIKNVNYYNSSTDSHITISYLYLTYSNCYEDVYEFLEQHIKLSSYWKLPISTLTKEEFTTFYAIRDDYVEGNYETCLKNTSNLFENKIQKMIHNIFNIFYGVNFEAKISPDLMEYIYSKINNPEDLLMIKESEKEYYEYFTRIYFKDIIVSGVYGSLNWDEIYKYVFTRTKKEEIIKILNNLSDTNQYIITLKDQYISVDQQKYIKNYILNVIKCLQKINLFYVNLFKYGHRYKDKTTNKNYIIFNCCGYDDITKLSPIEVDKDVLRIFDSIKSRKMLTSIHLDDKEYVESYFNNDYRKIYAFISLLNNITPKELIQFEIEGKINIKNNRYGGATVDIEYIPRFQEKQIKELPKVALKNPAFHNYQVKIDNFERLIKEYREESVYQVFLEQNYMFLDPRVEECHPQKSFGGEAFPDFILKLNDLSYLIVEIEKPGTRLFNNNQDPSHEFTHAQQQIRTYMSWVVEDKEFLRKRGLEKIGEDNIHGLLIIGDASKLNEIEKKRIDQMNLEVKTRYSIKTFDKLLKENKTIFKNIQAEEYNVLKSYRERGCG